MKIDDIYTLNPFNETERDMQSKLSSFLKEQGFNVIQELQMGDKGRSDILATMHDTTYIIECKKRLTRDNFYKAAGQIVWYATAITNKNKILKQMIVYGGTKRVSFDNSTIGSDIAVMWYYDALIFFNAYTANTPYPDPKDTEKDIGTDPTTALSKIPAFVDFAKIKMSEDAEWWQRTAKFDKGILGVCATAMVFIVDGKSTPKIKSQEDQS